MIQTLVRSMPDLHKTLILAHVQRTTVGDNSSNSLELNHGSSYDVQEIAVTSEHAPFRHKKIAVVGGQAKKIVDRSSRPT